MIYFSENIQQDDHCIVYLCNELWFQILFYLRIIDVIRYRSYREDCELSSLIINKSELYECFMKRFDELIKRLSFYFDFTDCFYLNYQLQSVKNEFYITNIL